MPQPSRPTMTPSMMRTPRFFLRFASHTFCAFRGPAPRAFRLSSRAAYARPIPKLIWLGWPPDFAAGFLEASLERPAGGAQSDSRPRFYYILFARAPSRARTRYLRGPKQGPHPYILDGKSDYRLTSPARSI